MILNFARACIIETRWQGNHPCRFAIECRNIADKSQSSSRCARATRWIKSLTRNREVQSRTKRRPTPSFVTFNEVLTTQLWEIEIRKEEFHLASLPIRKKNEGKHEEKYPAILHSYLRRLRQTCLRSFDYKSLILSNTFIQFYFKLLPWNIYDPSPSCINFRSAENLFRHILINFLFIFAISRMFHA